jgi:hypothetical protein
LYCITEVRAMTLSSRNRDSFEISSSVMPSEKYSSAGSALMLANGSTAMRYLSKGACGAATGGVEAVTGVTAWSGDGGARSAERIHSPAPPAASRSTTAAAPVNAPRRHGRVAKRF